MTKRSEALKKVINEGVRKYGVMHKYKQKSAPKVKGSAYYDEYHKPKETHAKAEAIREAMSHHSPEKKYKTKKFLSDYQRRTGRGYHE